MPTPPPPVFRVTAERVQFDALFLDARHRPVTDIRRGEVTVKQAGTPVTLVDFRFQPRAGTRSAPAADLTPRAPSPASSGTNTITTVPSPPSDDEAWVFLIDDAAMSPDAFERARAGLLAILRDGLPAGTAMGILGTGEPGAQTTRLTDDHGTFLSAVTSMRYKNRGWRGSPTSRSGSTGASTTNRDQVFLEGTLGSLNSLILSLRALPGRKVVVVMSELIGLTADDVEHGASGFLPTVGFNRQYVGVASRMRRLGRLAAESGVTVHSIDLSGVVNADSRRRAALNEGLHAVADEMGGVYFGGSNDAGDLLAAMLATEQDQYVLAYEPPAGTLDADAPARFVPLSVSVSRAGVTVRTRSGFFTR